MKRPLLAMVACAACGSDANVAGSYTVASTNRDNGCMLNGWTVGAMASGIAVDITQSGSNVTANINGAAGLALDVLLGAHTYTGDVSGSDIALQVFGTRSNTRGNCTFTYNSTISASSNGDAIQGRIDYTPATNGNPDCSTVNGCVSFQDFNGTRPPR